MENWREISEDIVSSLLEDGSDPEILYEVEHHFVCEDFPKLEQAALAAFKLGYDVEEPAELELEDGSKICIELLITLESKCPNRRIQRRTQ